MGAPAALNTGVTITLDSTGAGTATLGPNTGPPIWHVTYAAVFTSRPGQAPVPSFMLYVDSPTPANQIGLTYDGSFDESDIDTYLTRGQTLIGVWSGGQSGDTATLSIAGEKLNQ